MKVLGLIQFSTYQCSNIFEAGNMLPPEPGLVLCKFDIGAII